MVIRSEHTFSQLKMCDQINDQIWLILVRVKTNEINTWQLTSSVIFDRSCFLAILNLVLWKGVTGTWELIKKNILHEHNKS